MNSENIIKTLGSLKTEVKKRYKADIKGIFGSYARGEEKETSDVDVLVEFKEDADLLDYVGLSLLLEETLGVKVDIVSERAVKKEIKPFIMKEIIPV